MKTTPIIARARVPLSALITALTLTSAATSIACDCAKSAALSPAVTASDAPASPSRKFPLKGVITDLLPDRPALMVKHEAIPGVMKAMTMMFTVDASVLTTVKKGDAITALMSRTAEGDWRLDEVKVAPPAN